MHPWIRLNRVVRDIPSNYILGGVDAPNMREDVLAMMRRRGLKCRCIRCREVGDIGGLGQLPGAAKTAAQGGRATKASRKARKRGGAAAEAVSKGRSRANRDLTVWKSPDARRGRTQATACSRGARPSSWRRPRG